MALILFLTLLITGCQPNISGRIGAVEINEALFITDVETGSILKANVYEDAGGVTLKDGDLELRLDFVTSNIYWGKYIVGVMNNKPIKENNIIYIPLEFLTDFLGLPVEVHSKNRLFMPEKEHALYNAVKSLPENFNRSSAGMLCLPPFC